MADRKLVPIHPGEILLEEFLKPMHLSQNRLARGIGVPPRRINEIVLAKRRLSADTALRLARFLGTSPQFWAGLQADYDLDVAADALGHRLERKPGRMPWSLVDSDGFYEKQPSTKCSAAPLVGLSEGDHSHCL